MLLTHSTQADVVRIRSAGMNAANSPWGAISTIVNLRMPTISYQSVRSYNVLTINRANLAIVSHRSYDTHADSNSAIGTANATAMANYLNSLSNDVYVIVNSHDEPQSFRTTGGLPAAIYRCGGTSAVFESAAFYYRSAYTLIGIPGAGAGTGIQKYTGGNNNQTGDVNAYHELKIRFTPTTFTQI